ncbi:Guanylate cyclase [Seminavis robusta]|uniref:Guanylate cyclase n=1 Tax=Seminavis robusta TaxID=568900 RepID=A0A9N8HD29_9STRA|nr:Guanylate cyclase [Seminavis robusta]|eukprot:Sro407_g136590.1 Guanylate cyclase (463) ;mRNA; r:15835-17444
MQEAPHDESSVNMSGYDSEHATLTKEDREEIAERESRWVFCMRMIVLAVLLASAATVVALVFTTMVAQEEKDFESKFGSAADVVFESVGRTFDQVLGSTDSFVGHLVSYNEPDESKNVQGWPYVTMPRWGYHSAKLLKQSKAYNSGYCVVVQQEEIPKWLNFSTSNLEWVDEAKAVQAKTDEYWADLSTNFTSPVLPFVWSVGAEGLEAHAEPTPYMNNYPTGISSQRQLRRMASGVGNFHRIHHRVPQQQDGRHHQRRQCLAQRVRSKEVLQVEAAVNYSKNFLTPGRGNASEPNGFIIYPIFDSLDSPRLDRSQDQEPLGYYWYTYFWKDYIQNILPEGTDGVVAVFKNSCGKPFSYRLDGPKTTYLGGGDLHDTKYDYLERSQTLHQLMDSTKQSAEGSSYTGLPLSDWFCPTTLRPVPLPNVRRRIRHTWSPHVYPLGGPHLCLYIGRFHRLRLHRFL